MKRKLTEEEKKLTLSGIRTKKNEILDLKEALSANQAEFSYVKSGWKYEDETRDFSRKGKTKQYENTISLLKEQIAAAEYSISEMEKHLKEGVEQKSNSAVGQ